MRRETHEKLKIGDKPLVVVYYCAREDAPRFHRRCYWLLDDAKDASGVRRCLTRTLLHAC